MIVAKSFRRVAALYATIERMRSLDLRESLIAVDDVVCWGSIAMSMLDDQTAEGRAALGSGRRADWKIAEMTRDVIQARIIRLANLRREREIAMTEATIQHQVSRLSLAQMERVVDRMQRANAKRVDHQQQAESDDRFASRRAWASTEDDRTSE